MSRSLHTFSRLIAKRISTRINESASCCSRSYFKNLQVDRHFSAASNQDRQRCVPSTIVPPLYVTSGQFEAPSQGEVKSDEQISQMRPACRLAAAILQHVGTQIKVGMSTGDIDDIVYSKCLEAGAYPSPLLYKGFPRSVCTSVNEVACHGIPGPEHTLREGDIVNVDVTVFYKGYHGDTSATFAVGEVDPRSRALMLAAEDCLEAGISVCRDGAPFSNIGEIIFERACEAGFEVIPFFCGHGIGTYFHGPPDIVHVPSDYCGPDQMKAGMTFTIEPILCDGSPEIKILNDGWTVVTEDGCRSAQYEHTILVTQTGREVLTR